VQLRVVDPPTVHISLVSRFQGGFAEAVKASERICVGGQMPHHITEVTTIDDAGRFTGAEGAKGRAWHKEDTWHREGMVQIR